MFIIRAFKCLERHARLLVYLNVLKDAHMYVFIHKYYLALIYFFLFTCLEKHEYLYLLRLLERHENLFTCLKDINIIVEYMMVEKVLFN